MRELKNLLIIEEQLVKGGYPPRYKELIRLKINIKFKELEENFDTASF